MYNIFKFRAWSHEHNKMVYSDTCEFLGISEIEWVLDEKGIYFQLLKKIDPDNRPYISGLMTSFEYYTPEQDVMIFTGMYDVDKKPIYQGDIIKCIEPDFSGHVGGTGYSVLQRFNDAVVNYYNGAFYYYPNGNMKQPHQLLSCACEIEIKGNIYEN